MAVDMAMPLSRYMTFFTMCFSTGSLIHPFSSASMMFSMLTIPMSFSCSSTIGIPEILLSRMIALASAMVFSLVKIMGGEVIKSDTFVWINKESNSRVPVSGIYIRSV